MTAATQAYALVLAAYGRRFIVRNEETGQETIALTKGRDLGVAVGDRVMTKPAGGNESVITELTPRRSLFIRSAARKSKTLAANIDQVALVIAPSPHYSEQIVLRVMIAAHAADLPMTILANKQDHERFTSIEPRLALFESLGVNVISISALIEPASARDLVANFLDGQTTLLCGESGMGKSTLLNLLVPDADQRTASISAALKSGKHTTTSSRLFDLNAERPGQGYVIDSPGFQQFGLAHLSMSEREHAMPDFNDYLGQCRFHNCQHTNEPGCAIRAALEANLIDPLRYRLFLDLAEHD